jgi:DUF1707 SHOCT-like domain
VVARARIPIDRPPFNSCADGGLKSGVGVRRSVEHTTDSERAVSHPSVSPGTEGRLSKGEHDARLDSALSARTAADLDQVVTDRAVALQRPLYIGMLYIVSGLLVPEQSVIAERWCIGPSSDNPQERAAKAPFLVLAAWGAHAVTAW